tara:strand:- start:479 stop:1399 length:921 start_codon:yes stop_codon:yes gene_type:complete
MTLSPISAISALILVGALYSCHAQELEPRRWDHLPTGVNFGGTGYAYTKGDILFNPVLLIEDAELEMHTVVIKYVHTFEMFDKLARVDFVQGYRSALWRGILDGKQASANRVGWSDTVLRFSMNLIGSPPLDAKEFAEYRKTVGEHETIVGAGIAVHIPTGHYLDDKLLNIGTNRYTIRPQIGVVKTWNNWSLDVTGSTWIFTDNDEFWNGNTLEQDPLFSVQGHLVYTFRPGLWISTGAAWARGAQSKVNGMEKNDRKTNVGWGVSGGYSFTPQAGIKVGYINYRARERVGADLDNFVFGMSYVW